MKKNTFIKEIEPHVELHRCPKTGIAWVENGKTGGGHSAHPNIDVTGSVRGMKAQGYWHKDDVCVKSHGFIYNLSKIAVSDEYDKIALQYCRCGKH